MTPEEQAASNAAMQMQNVDKSFQRKAKFQALEAALQITPKDDMTKTCEELYQWLIKDVI